MEKEKIIILEPKESFEMWSFISKVAKRFKIKTIKSTIWLMKDIDFRTTMKTHTKEDESSRCGRCRKR